MASTVNAPNIVGTDGMPLNGAYDSGSGLIYPLAGGAVSTDTSHNSQKSIVMQTQAATSTKTMGALAPSNYATYAASITGLVPAASCTDLFTLTGAASTVIRIMRVVIACTTTAATGAALDVVLLKRSTANTAGTSTTPTVVAFDSADAAAAGVVNAYTVNPTTGTLVGNLFATKIQQALATPTATDFPTLQPLVVQFGVTDSKPVVLRAATEVFAVNLAAQSAAAGALWDITIEWAESAS